MTVKKKKNKRKKVKKPSRVKAYKRKKRPIKKKIRKNKRLKKRKKSTKNKRKKVYKSKNSKNTFRKIIRFSENIKPKINFKFDLDRTLQNFFQNIANKIKAFKEVIDEEREKKRQQKIRLMQKEKAEEIKRARDIKKEEIKKKQIEIQEEIKLGKERRADIKRFIRLEQAQLRKEQADRQRKFYEKIRLEKKIEQFRKREALEIKNLEKYVLKQERENYQEVQHRIDKIKQKYQAIRDQKIKERIEQLGIEVSDTDTREDLLQKEYEFNLAREKIENTLESFYRSMVSCIFQLNKRWLPKKMSLMRVIDKRYETSEIFIKLDEESDENWIMLVYLKDNNPDSNIVVEDKTDHEKIFSQEYKSNEIFKFSDSMVDSLTTMIDKEYQKKLN
tara:strand:+ start:240 stop:1406 length:1167 start_codon:yes stop_codon:yes gene_type:complete